MKRMLALVLTLCLMLSFAPPVAAAGGESGPWSYRYAGEYADDAMSVSVYDAAAGEFTLRGFEQDFDPETYETIFPYTVPEEKTGDYWVHTSLADKSEIFPAGGEFYALIFRPDYPESSLAIHALSESEIAGGLTVTEDMFASLASLSLLGEEPDYSGSSSAMSQLTLSWQAARGGAAVDLSEMLLLCTGYGQGSYALNCTPGFFSAVRVYSVQDWSGSGMPVSTEPAVVDLVQTAVTGSYTFDFSSHSTRGKHRFTAALAGEGELSDLSVTAQGGFSFNLNDGSFYITPGVYEISAAFTAGDAFSGEPMDQWVYISPDVDLTSADSGVTYDSLGAFASFTRSPLVYADGGFTTLRSTAPAAGETVYLDYDIRDTRGNKLAAVASIGAFDLSSFEMPEVSYLRPTLSAGGSPVSLSGGESLTGLSFAAALPTAEHTVSLDYAPAHFDAISVRDSFFLDNAGGLADVGPNAPGNLAVRADRGANTAVFTYDAATHPNPNANVTEYRLYVADGSGAPTGQPVATATGLQILLADLAAVAPEDAETFFVLRAWDGTLESPASNAVRVAPADMGTLRYAASGGATLSVSSLTLSPSNLGALTLNMDVSRAVTDPVAVLEYRTPAGAAKETAVPMTSAEGGYAAALSVPGDAARLTGLRAEYTTLSGAARSLFLPLSLEVIAGAMTITLEGLGVEGLSLDSAVLGSGARQQRFDSPAWEISGADMVITLPLVSRLLYAPPMNLTADFLGTLGQGDVSLSDIENDAVTVSADAVREIFGARYAIPLTFDDSALAADWRATAFLDLFAGGVPKISRSFPGVSGDTTLEFWAAGSFEGYELSFQTEQSVSFRDTAGDGLHPLNGEARSFTVTPYVPENGSPIPITLDGEPLECDAALLLTDARGRSYVRLFYAQSGLAELTDLPDGDYSLSLYSASAVEIEPVTLHISGGRAADCPELKLFSQVYYGFGVQNLVTGMPGQEYAAEYEAEVQLRGSEEWLPAPVTVSWSFDFGLEPGYCGNLFVGPFRTVDVLDESGALAISRLRLTPGSVFTRLDRNSPLYLFYMSRSIPVTAQPVEVNVTGASGTVVNRHKDILNTPRYDLEGEPLTFTGEAHSALRIQVNSQGATEGETQLNLFFFAQDNLGNPTGETWSEAFILSKYNEAANQVVESAGTYAPGVYSALFYLGAHDGAREDNFFYSGGTVTGAGAQAVVFGLNGSETATLIITLPETEAKAGFTAELRPDMPAVTEADIAGFTLRFTADATLSGESLTLTPLGGWAAPAGVADLRASLTLGGAACPAETALNAEGNLQLTLPAIPAGETLEGTLRVGYGIAAVPADGSLMLRASLGEETVTAAASCIRFQHDIPSASGTDTLALRGRAPWPGEEAFIALYADGVLSGWYALSKYGFWGGGYGEYRDLTLPDAASGSHDYEIAAYLLTGKAAELPATAENLENPLCVKTLAYEPAAAEIAPTAYIYRYYDITADSVTTFSAADAGEFRSFYLSFPQTYEGDWQELTLLFDGDVSGEITVPTVTVALNDCLVTYRMGLDYAGESGTSYSLRWSAVYFGAMTVTYGLRPENESGRIPRPTWESFRFADLSPEELARLQSGWEELCADADRTIVSTRGGSLSIPGEDGTLNIRQTTTLRAMTWAEAQTWLTENTAAAEAPEGWETGGDLLYTAVAPAVTFDESDPNRDIFRLTVDSASVFRTGDLSTEARLFSDDDKPSAGETVLLAGTQFVGDFNGYKGYIDMAKSAMEASGVREDLVAMVPLQDGETNLGKGLQVVGYVGTGLNIITRFATESEITKEQRETIEKRISDINGMYSFAMAKCRCKGNDVQAKMLAQARDSYLQELKQMLEGVRDEELNCEILSTAKDVSLAVAGEAVNPIVGFAIDKGVDAALDDYRYQQNIERYDRGDDILVRCGDELDRISASCSREGCREEPPEIQRKPVKTVEVDLGDDSRWGRRIELRPQISVDPSGIVYEGYPENPLAGVECVIYESAGDETGPYREWSDADAFDGQRSRITTGDRGCYEWFVPAGYWKVSYEKEGYLPAESQAMKVAPQWLDVNQNLLALDNGSEASLRSEGGNVILSFTKPVIYDDILAGGFTVTLGGMETPGSWSILRGGEGEIYADGVSGPATGTGMLAREVCFTPDELPVTGTAIRAELDGAGVRSYGGTPMEAVTLTGAIAGGLNPAEGWEDVSGNGASADDGSETGVLTPAGSELSAFDGAIRLTAEAGIVSADTRVTFTRMEAEDAGALSPAYGLYFAVQPADTAEVFFRLDESAAAVEEPLFLGLWVLPEGSEEWQFAGGAYDGETNSLVLLTRVNGLYEARYEPVSFRDLPEGHWAADYMEILAARHILLGDENGDVHPNDYITRAETAALTVRVLGANSLLGRTPEVRDNFPDVTTEDWFWYEMNLAAKRGILEGYEDGTARPRENITRQELAAIVARMAADTEALARTPEPGVRDAEAIAGWAKTFVALLEELDFVEGDENGNFNPASPARRCEVAKLMVKLMELYGMLEYDPEAKDPPCLTCPYSR